MAERRISHRKLRLQPYPPIPYPCANCLRGVSRVLGAWRPSGYRNLLQEAFRCRALVLAEWVPQLGGYVMILGFSQPFDHLHVGAGQCGVFDHPVDNVGHEAVGIFSVQKDKSFASIRQLPLADQ